MFLLLQVNVCGGSCGWRVVDGRLTANGRLGGRTFGVVANVLENPQKKDLNPDPILSQL